MILTLPWAYYLKKDGILLVNNQEIMPMPVITGMAEYPDSIFSKLAELGKKTVVVEGLNLACAAGNSKAVNVVMIGALCALIGISFDVALEAVHKCVPQKLLTVNEKALELGYNIK